MIYASMEAQFSGRCWIGGVAREGEMVVFVLIFGFFQGVGGRRVRRLSTGGGRYTNHGTFSYQQEAL